MHDYRLVPVAGIIWLLTLRKIEVSNQILFLGVCAIILSGIIILATSIFPYITYQILACATATLCALGTNNLSAWQDMHSLLAASARQQTVVRAELILTHLSLQNFSAPISSTAKEIGVGSRGRLYKITSANQEQRYREEICITQNSTKRATLPAEINLGDPLIIEGKITRTTKYGCKYSLKAEKIQMNSYPSYLHRCTSFLRRSFQHQLRLSSAPHSALIAGVVLGDDAELPLTAKRNLQNAGLAHLTAVSGSHISLLLGSIIFLVGKRKPLRTAFAATILLMMLAVLVGLSASVLRATLMGLGVILALALERRTDSLPLLALSVILSAEFFPSTAANLGFQMSVAATFAILTAGYFLQKRIQSFLPGKIAGLISYPLVAGVAAMPLTAQIQDSLSLWTVIANLAVVPVVAPFTICGLLGIVLSPFPHFCSIILLKICNLSAAWILKVADLAAWLPGGTCPIFTTFFLHLLLVVILLLITRRKYSNDVE